MNFFKVKNTKIKHKLTAVIMLTTTLALIAALSAFITFEYLDIKKNMVKSLTTNAGIIADISKTALSSEKAEDTRNILNSLYALPYIVHARICTSDGRTFASYNKDNRDKSIHLLNIKGDGHNFRDGFLNLQKAIVLDGERIGTIYLKAGLKQMRQELFRKAMTGLTASAILIFIAYLLSSKIQKIISRPILTLSEAAKEISENKDYSVRLTKKSSDETSRLIDAFNELLYEIQKRDVELSEINKNNETGLGTQKRNLSQTNIQMENLNRELEDFISKLNTANLEFPDFVEQTAGALTIPLRAIGNLAGMLLQNYSDKLDESGKKQLELLVRKIEQMKKLISEIPRYCEAGKVS